MAKKKQLEVFDNDLDALKATTGANSGNDIKLQQSQRRVYPIGSFGLSLGIGAQDPKTGKVGLPARSKIELYGRTGSLKTGTAFSMIRSVQEDDPSNIVACLFAEEPNAARMEQEGIDLNRLAIIGYQATEDFEGTLADRTLMSLCQFAQKPYIKLCVIDSLGALGINKDLLDDKGNLKEFDASSSFANRAKVFTKFMNTFDKVNHSSILLYTNHEKDKIQPVGFMPKNLIIGESLREATLGGTGKDFLATHRINCSTRPLYDGDAKHPLFENKVQIGLEVIYKITKNWCAKFSGSRKVISSFYFKEGKFREVEDVFRFAEYLGIIEMSTSRSWVIDGEKIAGKDNCLTYLEENPNVCKKIKEQIIPRADDLFEIRKLKVEEILS